MKVLIYDGECNMCSKFIRFIIRINRNPTLYVTDFNSNWTRDNVKLDPNIDSMIFISEGKQYIYSNSIIHLFMEANFFFKPIFTLKLIPRVFRDKMYKKMAEKRRDIIKSDSCPIPSNKAREMFLN